MLGIDYRGNIDRQSKKFLIQKLYTYVSKVHFSQWYRITRRKKTFQYFEMNNSLYLKIRKDTVHILLLALNLHASLHAYNSCYLIICTFETSAVGIKYLW